MQPTAGLFSLWNGLWQAFLHRSSFDGQRLQKDRRAFRGPLPDGHKTVGRETVVIRCAQGGSGGVREHFERGCRSREVLGFQTAAGKQCIHQNVVRHLKTPKKAAQAPFLFVQRATEPAAQFRVFHCRECKKVPGRIRRLLVRRCRQVVFQRRPRRRRPAPKL